MIRSAALQSMSMSFRLRALHRPEYAIAKVSRLTHVQLKVSIADYGPMIQAGTAALRSQMCIVYLCISPAMTCHGRIDIIIQ